MGHLFEKMLHHVECGPSRQFWEALLQGTTNTEEGFYSLRKAVGPEVKEGTKP